MNSSMLRAILDDEVSTYHRDGVVMMPQLFDGDWIELLKRGLETNCAAPTSRARVWDRDAAGRTMFWDSQAWQGVDAYRRFVFESPAAEIAARVMGSERVNFFFDAVFVRSPGSQFRTPWHQDEPYWTVEGYDTCTLWMPLVAVRRESALAFVPGSHRLDKRFSQYNFGELNPDGKNDVDQVDFSVEAELPFPDIDADPEQFGVVSWDMQPGDCIAFNGLTMHGGSGRLPEDCDLRVFTTKWLGDDVRIRFRECGMDPDFSQTMRERGLKPGDRPGTDLYPQLRP